MDKAIAKKRIENLKAEINKHRYNYHVLDQISLSEAALDSLKNELFKLENEFPEFISPDSPTQRVEGKPLAKFEKVNHRRGMISLFDAFTKADILAWQERNENYLKLTWFQWKTRYYAELKLDGLAISIRYQSSQFEIAATRGDGLVGENVSHNVRTIDSIPLVLRIPSEVELQEINFTPEEIKKLFTIIKNGELEVRGEAIITKQVLQDLNKKYTQLQRPLLANARNAVAGSIRQLDARVVAERNLDFYAYDLLLAELSRGEIVKTKTQMDALLKLLGFKTLIQSQALTSLDDLFKFYDQIERKRDKLVFEIDGLVVKIDDLKLWNDLGVTGKAPRYMIAYKFSAEQATSKLLAVEWQIGRTGILTPIAHLEPVKVAGALISRSTLHNYDEIQRLNLRIGDTVIIERSGDVIPKVVEVLSSLRTGQEKKILPPKFCPMCGFRVEKIKDEVAHRCTNQECYAVNLRKIIHFISKGALNFVGLGPKVIEQFLQVGLIKDAADLYLLSTEDLLGLEGFADKKADNIIKTIQAKKKVELARFIYSLGIRHVGEETAIALANIFLHDQEINKGKLKQGGQELIVTIPQLIKFFQAKTSGDLQNISDIGPAVATSIGDFWHLEQNLSFLKKLAQQGLSLFIKPESVNRHNLSLQGKSFVLTGTLFSLTRQQAKDKIKLLGGVVKNNLNSQVDYLLLGDKPGSKLNLAQQLGTKIITEDEFLQMLT